MNGKKTPKKNGRPRKDVDLELLESLCSDQCTDAEIAAALDISIDTITRRKAEAGPFAEVYKRGKETGKTSLRRLQWQTAQGIEPKVMRDDDGHIMRDQKGGVVCTPGQPPHATMQIWLGKQLLGQQETVKTDMVISGGKAPVEVSLTPESMAKALEILADSGALKRGAGDAKGQSGSS